jgi:hypothetical protein
VGAFITAAYLAQPTAPDLKSLLNTSTQPHFVTLVMFIQQLLWLAMVYQARTVGQLKDPRH